MRDSLEIFDSMKRTITQTSLVGRYSILMLLTCLLLCSCVAGKTTSTNSPYTRDLLGLDICENPCWKGISPGSSTDQDLLGILHSTSTIDQNSIERQSWEGKPGFESISWNTIDAGPNDSGEVGYIDSDNIVWELYIFPSETLTLRDFIDQLGQPDYYRLGIIAPPQTAGGRVIWLRQGLEVAYLAPKISRESDQIALDSEVYYVHYFISMSSLAEFLTSYFGYSNRSNSRRVQQVE